MKDRYETDYLEVLVLYDVFSRMVFVKPTIWSYDKSEKKSVATMSDEFSVIAKNPIIEDAINDFLDHAERALKGQKIPRNGFYNAIAKTILSEIIDAEEDDEIKEMKLD
jgi:hypothetical protein